MIMGSWRNWSAQDSYTIEVGGSSPSLPTIKRIIIIIDYGIATELINRWFNMKECLRGD